MELAIACSSCGRPIPVTRADAGTLVHCPACERPTRAPALEALEPPANVARTALARTAIAPAAGAPEPDGSALSLEVARARADPAKRFGHFVLLAKLGKGGMGVVHRAWNDRLRREVALKTILAADEVDEETLRRFHREAEAVARLRHQNIVSVFEAGEIAGQHYLAMELVRGRTLEDRLRPQNDVRATTAVWNRGPARIPLNKALEALRDVARAVHYAHEQGVVHRDLKPLNIMIDESGQARVLDFGVAHVSGAGTKLTKTGGRIGTLVYMAPEQAGGAHVDARSDVYALGATLYDVLTNRPPFVGDSELQIVSALLRSEPEPPGLLNPRVAGDLETICLKCLAKEPERRYATAAALADDLDRFLAGEPMRRDRSARSAERGAGCGGTDSSPRRSPWSSPSSSPPPSTSSARGPGAPRPNAKPLAKRRRERGPSSRPAAARRPETARSRWDSTRSRPPGATRRSRGTRRRVRPHSAPPALSARSRSRRSSGASRSRPTSAPLASTSTTRVPPPGCARSTPAALACRRTTGPPSPPSSRPRVPAGSPTSREGGTARCSLSSGSRSLRRSACSPPSSTPRAGCCGRRRVRST
ncbi:serine/threonine protein kinase [bacterium]|nr:serine/threonine protein kinase [bacterium]